MSAVIIDGKQISASFKEKMRERIVELEAKYGRKPCLAVIIVGEDPASQSYVRGKIKAAAFVGMDSRLIELPATISEEELLGHIADLNADGGVDGILVQLPLPRHINSDKVIEAIVPMKDVDGFHPMNVANLWLGLESMVPCTPKGIMKLLETTGINPDGKIAVIVGRSNIVGKPVAKLLLDANATVIIAHTHTADLKKITLQADILVVAAGKIGLLKGDMVKPGAVVIDVGIGRNSEGKLAGDVDFQSVSQSAGYLTPVPGGVGPMTITMLMENTIECFINRMNAV
ncbi:MAG: bifunctional methylenetetrahydrofolate dehydrogenase/methenyltetrahydrofolate cyclohydrolase FolD [Bacteroidales bacterium]|nr:bifunctional methylenetetrahydrofolate dehydrogenase/methenyltetrahydrofolate cyclohydrolase FolD [Candidatus Cacconaster merdequi]